MTLRIYNTLTRTKEVFTPIDPTNVRMYVCGPTVYDYAHIGNARPAIVFDVMFRLLRHLYGETHVTYVRNITDVDDKINARALRDYPGMELNTAIRAVTEKTYDQYQKDVNALGCLPPTAQPRATEHIGGMVEMIRILINRGHAYEAGGEVLFDVLAMKDYGALSGRKQEDLRAGARIAVDAHKKSPGDFVLWKQSAADEPGWDSPWGRGRPGWHIECSVMSKAHLGEVFDIHGGGLDLIFPHHENELAQSRCANGTDVMANYWMHNGFLQVEGQKMSKSSGNFYAINELLETSKFGGLNWDGRVVRWAMLSTHYRQPIDWTSSKLIEAAGSLLKFKAWDWKPNANIVYPPVLDALMDDLNLPKAMAELFVLLEVVSGTNVADAHHQANADMVSGTLRLLGISDLSDYGSGGDPEISRENKIRAESLIIARLEARKAKDWKKSDEIRDELTAMGISIKDIKDPVTGELKTEWEVKR